MPLSEDDLAGFDNVVALPRAAAGSLAKPEPAGQAVQLAQSTGFPSSVVGADLESFQQIDKGQRAAAAIERNQWISGYVARNPAAAEVSNDDYDRLDELTKRVQPFTVAGRSGGLLQAAPEFFINTIPELGHLISTPEGRGRLMKGLGKFAEQFANILGTPGDAVNQGFDIHDPADMERAQSLGLLIGLGKGSPKIENVPRVGRSTPQEINAFLSRAEGMKTRAEMDDFLAQRAAGDKDPKVVLQIEQAKADSTALDQAVVAANATATRTRAPTLLEDFVKGHETGTLTIPAETIAEIYRAEGKVPAQGDGLFGFVADLPQRLVAGAETGLEIDVPVSSYIAHIDPTVHEKVKEGIRFSNDGLTLAEAKEAKSDKIEAFHGSPYTFDAFSMEKIGTGEGAQSYGHGLYFAENRTVAESYALPRSQDVSFDKPLPDLDKPISLYKVAITANREHFLDWDKALSEQPQAVQEFIARKISSDTGSMYKGDFDSALDFVKSSDTTGGDWLDMAGAKGGAHGFMWTTAAEATKEMATAGIPGIKYLDQGSRKELSIRDNGLNYKNLAGEAMRFDVQDQNSIIGKFKTREEAEKLVAQETEKQTRNFVIFDPKSVTILERNGQALRAATQVEETELGLRPLFAEPLPGMTKTDFERYNKKVTAIQQKALNKATEVQTREAAKRRGEEWKVNEAALRPEVEAQVRTFPDIAADRFLRDGTLPDGSKIAKVRLDEGYVNALLVKNEIPAVMLDKAGIHPDDIAPLFGFQSGAALVRSLNDLNAARRAAKESPAQHLKRLTDEELAAQMEAKYGNLEAAIADEARALALDNLHFDILSDELRALATEAGGQPPLSKDAIKAMAQGYFDRLDSKSAADFAKFQKTAGRNGLLAERALLAGDPVEAFNAKQRQAINFLFAKEAQKFGKLVDRIAKKIDRVTKNDSIASMDQAHFDQLKKVLVDLGFEAKGEIPQPAESLGDFVANSDGQLAVAAWLTDGTMLPRDPSKLTVQQMTELGKSIDSMMHVGREVKMLDSAYGKATIENVVFDVVKELDRFDLIKQPLNKSIKQRVGSVVRKINAAHALPELILDYTDQFNPHGPLSQFLDRPLRAANNKEIEMTEAVVAKLRKLQKYTDSSIMDQIPNESILDPHTGEPLDINRRNLRQLMGFMGSESGIKKVVGGFSPAPNKELLGQDARGRQRYRVTAQTSAHQAKLVDDIWKMINENASEADWKWVAGMHEIFKNIFAEGKEMYLRDTGVSPDEIRALSMRSEKFGDFPGGYWPINYDKTRSHIDAHVFAKHGPFGPDYRPAVPPNSWTKSRTEFQGFLDLSGFMLDSEIRAMVHDIAFRESVRNASKLISNKTFMQEMTKKWGKEYADLFPKWLEDIAGSHKFDDAYAQGWARASAFLRQNVTSSLTWMAPSTIQKHGLSAFGMSVGEVGKGIFPAIVRVAADGMIDAARTLFRTKPEAPTPEIIQAIKDIADPGERGETTRQFIMDSSAVVRSRQRKFADSIKGAYEPSIYSPSSMVLWDARQMSMNVGRFPIAFVDAMSAYPTWLVAYKKAILENGGDKPQAVYEADKAMSRAHGSSSVLDRSALMRSGELMRWMTSLFGFWNHNTNIRMRMAWDIAGMTKGREEPGATTGQISNKFFWSILIPLMAEELATPYLDEDRRSWGHRMFLASLRFFGGGYVGLREITNGFAHGMEPSVGMMSTFLKTLSMAWKSAAGGNKSKNALINEVMAFSFLTGVGGAQLGRTGSYIKDRITGKERAGTVGQTLQGLRTGHSQPRIHK